jgi:hypothetical protein
MQFLFEQLLLLRVAAQQDLVFDTYAMRAEAVQ